MRPRGVRRGRSEGVSARQYPLAGQLVAGRTAGTALGLSIGRRAGKATVRTRIKRVLREAFRRAASRLPDKAVVVIAVEADLTKTPRREIALLADRLLERLWKLWESSPPRRVSPPARSSHSSGSTR